MFKKFIPDRIFEDVFRITPEIIKEYGKSAVIFDIDNTLTGDRNAEPDEKLKAYLQSVTDAGIKIALVSNNDRERVERFNGSLGFFATPKAGKPKKKALVPGLEYLQKAPGEILFVGDQILTDVLAARKHGITVFLVKPINPYENPFFYLKRLLEKPFLRAYYRKEKKKTQN